MHVVCSFPQFQFRCHLPVWPLPHQKHFCNCPGILIYLLRLWNHGSTATRSLVPACGLQDCWLAWRQQRLSSPNWPLDKPIPSKFTLWHEGVWRAKPQRHWWLLLVGEAVASYWLSTRQFCIKLLIYDHGWNNCLTRLIWAGRVMMKTEERLAVFDSTQIMTN